MNNTINGRTPEEIKRGLECLTKKCGGIVCRECELYVSGYEADANTKDALAYIQQLERERDAAIKDLRENIDVECWVCKHRPEGGGFCARIMDSGECWHWRGVQEVE